MFLQKKRVRPKKVEVKANKKGGLLLRGKSTPANLPVQPSFWSKEGLLLSNNVVFVPEQWSH